MKNLIRKILKEEEEIEDLNWIMNIEPSDFGYGVYDSLKDAVISQLGDYDNISIDDTIIFEGDNFTVYRVEIHSGRQIVTLKNNRTNKNFQIVLYDPIPPEWEKELPPLDEDLEYWSVDGNKMGPNESIIKKVLKVLKEYNYREKRSTIEITMALLQEAADHFAEGLRLIESATQFAYQENNEDLIRDLEKLRMTIQSGGDKMWAERDESMNIVNRINDIIKKYS